VNLFKPDLCFSIMFYTYTFLIAFRIAIGRGISKISNATGLNKLLSEHEVIEVMEVRKVNPLNQNANWYELVKEYEMKKNLTSYHSRHLN
jgi:hypothetical protein